MLVNLNVVCKSSWGLIPVDILEKDTHNLIFFAMSDKFTGFNDSANNLCAEEVIAIFSLELKKIIFVDIAEEDLNSDVFILQGR